VLGPRVLDLWQRQRKLCAFVLLVLLGLASVYLGGLLYSGFYDSAAAFMTWLYSDPEFNTLLFRFIFPAAAGFFVWCALILHFRKFIRRKISMILLLALLVLACVFLGTLLSRSLHKMRAAYSHKAVTKIIDPQGMFKGYSFYDGRLIDDLGKTVKKWSHGHLGTIDENGDYYGASHGEGYQGHTWGRYTWDDKAVWQKHFFIHHEIYLSPQGTVFTFTQDVHDYNGYKVAFDVILEFDKNGRQLQRYSFWDHLTEFRPYHPRFAIDVHFPLVIFFSKLLNLKLFDHPPENSYDYFHLNSFFMVPPNPLAGTNPAFRPGNWLVSLFHGSMVFILDRDTKKILWHAAHHDIDGDLDGQHSASMLPDGSILLFENGVDRKASRILIIDPLTLKIKWQYKAKKFFSVLEGFVQYLPNGNFLITESMKRRIFELTPDKRIVWEHRLTNPVSDKVGSVSFYPDEIYRATRYPQDMIDYFLLVTHELPSSGQTSATP